MFLEHYKLYWTNYINFRGRTPRAGYWFVVLWNAIIGLILGLIAIAVITDSFFSLAYALPYILDDPLELITDTGGLFALFIIIIVWNLANLIPNLALCIRRLHDTGRRWYYMFVLWAPPIIYIIVCLIISASSATTMAVGSFEGFYGGLLGGLASLFIFSVIMLIVGFIGFIAFFVFMCLSTTPDALGESTHANYPQWQDGYGRYTQGVNASIVGVSGMYRDVAFPIESDEELVIGRDAMMSHIVITQDAEKVSRRHLTISFDDYENIYIVTDHSTNGTYLADGTRIVSNIPVKLPSGTVIYLAKKTNSFRLG